MTDVEYRDLQALQHALGLYEEIASEIVSVDHRMALAVWHVARPGVTINVHVDRGEDGEPGYLWPNIPGVAPIGLVRDREYVVKRLYRLLTT